MFQPVAAPAESGVMPDHGEDHHGPKEQEGLARERAANANRMEQRGEVFAGEDAQQDTESETPRRKRRRSGAG